MTETRTLRSLLNFRDLGGLPTRDGRTTRSGVLYRSDNPHLASDEDVRTLTAEFGITDVIDLRSERELAADGWHDGFRPSTRVHHFPIAGGPGNAVEAAPTGERLAARYLEYLDDHGDSVTGAVRAVAESDGAAVVHCRVGKDRTGVVVAVILDAVGVQEEDIVRDFARTTAAMKQIMAQLRASPTYAANVSRLPEEMYRSDAPTMTAFLAKLRARDGGARQWLTAHGMTPAALDALTERLVG